MRLGIRRPRRDESGISLIIVALSLTAIIGMIALVIDGGAGFSDRRQVQNAVDAGSLAGANALFDYKAGGLAASTIWSAVQTTVQQNGAGNNTDRLSCVFVDFNGAPISPNECSTFSATGDPTVNAADGVLVTAGDTKKTSFAPAAGERRTLTAGAHAIATIQPVGAANTPFIICGQAGIGFDLLTNDKLDLTKLQTYAKGGSNAPMILQGAGPSGLKDKTCGDGSSCKGKANPGQPIVVPTYVPCSTGNGNSHTVLAAVDGQVPCPPAGPFSGCDLLIPIADGSNSTGEHVIAWTVWQAYGNGTGNPKYFGYFVAIGTPVTGAGGVKASCTVGTSPGASPCVVHLIQ